MTAIGDAAGAPRQAVERAALPVTVVVCTRNRAHEVEQCLQVIATNRPSDVLVVDGDSSDGTPELARRAGATVVSDEGRGLAYARYLGALHARQPYVAYVDSDVSMPPDTLDALLHELRDNGWVGIHAQVLAEGPSTYWTWAQDWHFRLTFNRPGPRAAIGRNCALFRADVLRSVGYFEGSPAAEDGDLGARLARAGHRLGVARDAVCYHRHPAEFGAFFRQRVWYGTGTMQLALSERSLARALGPLAMPFYGTALSLVRGKPRLVPYFWVNAVAYAVGMGRALLGSAR